MGRVVRCIMIVEECAGASCRRREVGVLEQYWRVNLSGSVQGALRGCIMHKRNEGRNPQPATRPRLAPSVHSHSFAHPYTFPAMKFAFAVIIALPALALATPALVFRQANSTCPVGSLQCCQETVKVRPLPLSPFCYNRYLTRPGSICRKTVRRAGHCSSSQDAQTTRAGASSASAAAHCSARRARRSLIAAMR